METLQCPNCKLQYNVFQRKPVVLQCGDTICEECVDSSLEPQSGKTITCPIDGAVFEKLEKLIFNKAIITILQSKQAEQGSRIYCSKHKTKECDFYCSDHMLYLCGKCLLLHAEHKQKIKKVNNQEINSRLKSYYGKLQEMIQLCNKKSEWISAFIDQDKNCFSLELNENLETCEKLLSPIMLKYDVIEQPFLPLPKIKQDPIIFLSESILATEQQDREQIKHWLQYKTNVITLLLYRGSRDGFKPSTFHSKCDGWGPTITLVRSTKKKIFGGFTKISWSSSVKTKKIYDKDAFVFSVTHKTKHALFEQYDYDFCISHSDNYLPVFCGGFGISVMQDGYCKQGISNLGSIYSAPPYLSESEETSYLAGEPKYYIDEIEVFQVVDNSF